MIRSALLMTIAMATFSWTLSPRATAAELDLSKLPLAAQKQGLAYSRDIRPIFEQSCIRCHSGDRPKAGLRLDSLEGALKGSKDGKVIVPGQSEKSPLIIAVARLDPDKAMPPEPHPGRFGRSDRPGGGPPGGPPPDGERPHRGPDGPGGLGPPPKPLTTEQVSLLRAWVDQGAK